MPFYVRKASGKRELFDAEKCKSSLRRSGAEDSLIDKIIAEIIKRKDLRTTKKIYDYALQCLDKATPVVAARYNIKRALEQLGPAGYPFEQFVAELFAKQGYDVQVGLMIPGWCVEHEVDVIAAKGKKHFMVECKFHGRRGLKTRVQTTLYIKARFDDIKKQWEEQDKHPEHELHEAWIVTNTRFSSQAIDYARCSGINLLGWSYPLKNNLQQLIDRLGVHPVTALTTLNNKQKKQLIREGFILCRDAHKHKTLLRKIGLTVAQVNKLVAEAEEVCEI